MYLKWKDYSGASHIIEGVEEAIGFPRPLHKAQVNEIAAMYDGDDVVIRNLSYPDIWHDTIEKAEKAGFSFDRETAVEAAGGESSSPPGVITSMIPRGSNSNVSGAAPGGSRAVWIGDTVRSEEVLRIQIGNRSFGIYIVATLARPDGSSRKREHLFIDTMGPVYLMSDSGQTIDRFSID